MAVSSSVIPSKAEFKDPLPVCKANYKPFPESIFQDPPPEPEYETEVTGGLRIRLKKSTKCKANPNTSGFKHDSFVVELLVLNLSQGSHLGSSTEERTQVLGMLKEGKVTVEQAIQLLSVLDGSPHTHGPLNFIDVKSRFFYNGNWIPAMSTKLIGAKEENRANSLPFEVGSRKAIKVEVECSISCEEKQKSGGGWFNRAFVSRIEPIIIEVSFEEMAGGTVSIQSSFRNAATSFPTPKPEWYFWLHVDDIELWDRVHVSVRPPTREDDLFEIHLQNQYFQITFTRLLVWGYKAFKAKSSIYKLEDSTEKCEINVLADLDHKLVWGFYFKVKSNENTNEGIWTIPDDIMEKGWRSVKEALEPDTMKNESQAPAVPPRPTSTSSENVPATSTFKTAAPPVYPPSPASSSSASTSSAPSPSPSTSTTPSTSAPTPSPTPSSSNPTSTTTSTSSRSPIASPSPSSSSSSPQVTHAAKPPAKPEKRGFKCGKCSFGPSKEDCIKCGQKKSQVRCSSALLSLSHCDWEQMWQMWEHGACCRQKSAC